MEMDLIHDSVEGRMFDIACNYPTDQPYLMKRKGKDPKILSVKQQKMFLNDSINRFVFNHSQASNGFGRNDVLSDSRSSGGEVVKLRAFSGSSDLPQLTRDVFNVTMETTEYDMAWTEAFRSIPLIRGQLSWEIATTGIGASFRVVPEGERVEIFSLTGEKKTVSIEKYGTGFGATWETIEGRKLYQFVQSLQEVRNRLYELWADVHYKILAKAATEHKITRAGSGSDSEIVRDIGTLNKAYIQVGKANKDSGYGNTSSAQMLLYVSPELTPRINAALRVTTADRVRGSLKAGEVVEFPIRVLTSWNSNIPANKGILVLPGHKIQNAIYMREMGFRTSDNLSLSDIQTYWSAFGAAVGDDKQLAEVPFA